MDRFVLSHLLEMYRRSCYPNTTEITPFYSEEEADEIISYIKNGCKNQFDLTKVHYFGGYPKADRRRLVFGNLDEIDEDLFVNCLAINPKNKFSEGFEHRQVLGAVLGLGLKRELIGDIIIDKPKAYLYFIPEALPLLSPLEKIGSEYVSLSLIPLNEVPSINNSLIKAINIPSLRLDVILAHIYGLSREGAKENIAKGLVKAHQEIVTKNDYEPKEGERISLKGYGKFRYLGMKGLSKKGKLIIEVEIYL